MTLDVILRDGGRVTLEHLNAGGAESHDVHALSRACTDADGAEPFNEATQLNLADRIPIRASFEGQTVGLALIRDASGAAEVEIAVHPDHRRRGIGAALLHATKEREASPVTAWAHGNTEGAKALAKRHGLVATRTILKLARPAAPTDARALDDAAPAGIEIRAFEPGRDDAEIARVNAAAFSWHPEQGQMDADAFAARIRQDWFRPEHLLVAADTATGAVLGFNWLKITDDEAEIYVLGVDPAAGGRGIGRALTDRGLALIASLGFDQTVLYVEADNEKALGLYGSLGFIERFRDVLYTVKA